MRCPRGRRVERSSLRADGWRLASAPLLFALAGCGGAAGGDGEIAQGEMEEGPLHEHMVDVLDPAADVVWGAAGYVISESGEESLAPTTPEGWRRVRDAVAVIADSGRQLQAPPLLPEESADAWIEFASGMATLAADAEQAAQDQDAERLFEVGGHIYNVCLACHVAYAREEGA